MNWVILLFASVIVAIGAAWYGAKKFEDWAFIVTFFGIVVAIACLCVIGCCKVSVPQEINTFTRQKEYIETHEAKDAIEDAAITAKKIELNGWLYDAQCSKARFGGWSFYPDSIFELEPIE